MLGFYPIGGDAIGGSGLSLVSISLGFASEASTSFSLSAIISRATGFASEASTSFSLSALISRPAGLAIETGAGLALDVNVIFYGVEADSAFALGLAMGNGIASEADAALTLAPLILADVGIAVEADTALRLDRILPAITPPGRTITFGASTLAGRTISFAASRQTGRTVRFAQDRQSDRILNLTE